MAQNKERRKQLLEQYKQRQVIGGVYQIRNLKTDRFLLGWDEDLAGAENRHNFSVQTNTGGAGSIVPYEYREDWKAYGGESFRFERLEVLEKKPEQTREEFLGDVELLYEIWKEKVDWTKSYKKEA